jgi:elongation factor G
MWTRFHACTINQQFFFSFQMSYFAVLCRSKRVLSSSIALSRLYPPSSVRSQPQKASFNELVTGRRYISHIRNIGILAHIDAGKTTTTENILYLTGKTNYIGKVDNGDTVMDHLPQEKERGITIASAAISCNWKDHQINIIDTPGHIDFSMEVEVATKVIDGCVLIIDAVSGVQCQTKTVWKKISSRNIPAIAFINKMDRDIANFQYSMSSIKDQLFIPTVALHHPIYELNSETKNNEFLGFIDLLSEQTFLWKNNDGITSASSKRGKNKDNNIDEKSFLDPIVEKIDETSSYYSLLLEKKQDIIDKLADIDENFMNYYLENLSSSIINNQPLNQQLFQSLQTITKQRKIIPVLCGSAVKGKGIHSLLDSILCFLPNPQEIPSKKLLSVSEDSNEYAMFPSIDSKKKLQQAAPEGFAKKGIEETLLGQVFKLVADPQRGNLAFIRLFSGNLEAKQMVFNTNKQKEERILSVLQISSNQFTPLSSISMGEIACITGCKHTRIGDTLINPSNKILSPYHLEGMIVPKPVFSLAIEPAELSQTQKDLEKILSIMIMEDPSLQFIHDKETEQIILYGLGELHLEIACDKIQRQFKYPIHKGKASIHYRETIQSSIQTKEFNFLYDRILDGKQLYAKVIFEFSSLSSSSIHEKSGFEFDNYHVSTFSISSIAKEKLTGEELAVLTDAIQSSLLRGPKGYPIVGLNIVIKDIEKLQGITTSGAIRACIATGIMQFLRDEENQQILEPMMDIEIELPNEYMGDVLSDLTSKRRAQNLEVKSLHENHSIITAVVPLQALLGYITSLRSMTRGEGIFSSEYVYHAPVDLCFFQE